MCRVFSGRRRPPPSFKELQTLLAALFTTSESVHARRIPTTRSLPEGTHTPFARSRRNGRGTDSRGSRAAFTRPRLTREPRFRRSHETPRRKLTSGTGLGAPPPSTLSRGRGRGPGIPPEEGEKTVGKPGDASQRSSLTAVRTPLPDPAPQRPLPFEI